MGLLWCCRLLQTTLRLSGQVQQLFTKNNSKPPQGLLVHDSSFTLVKPTQPQSAEKTRQCAMMKPSVEPPSGRPLLSLLQQQSTSSPALYVIPRTPCVLPCKGREGKEGESEKKPELISISGPESGEMDKIGDVGYKFQNCLAAARESAYAIGTAAPYRSACPCGRPNEQLTKNALLASQQAGRLAVGEGGRPGATKPLLGPRWLRTVWLG